MNQVWKHGEHQLDARQVPSVSRLIRFIGPEEIQALHPLIDIESVSPAVYSFSALRCGLLLLCPPTFRPLLRCNLSTLRSAVELHYATIYPLLTCHFCV